MTIPQTSYKRDCIGTEITESPDLISLSDVGLFRVLSRIRFDGNGIISHLRTQFHSRPSVVFDLNSGFLYDFKVLSNITSDISSGLFLSNNLVSTPAIVFEFDSPNLNVIRNFSCAPVIESDINGPNITYQYSFSSTIYIMTKTSSKINLDGDGWGSFTGDDFTGNNGDPPNPQIWEPQIGFNATYSIQNNKLNYDVTNTEDDSRARSLFLMVGDFDIQIDFDVTTEIQSTLNPLLNGRLLLENLAADRYMSMGRRMESVPSINTKVYEILQNNQSSILIPTTHDIGKFRITRSGSILKGYIWSGSQWEWNGNTAGYTYIATTSDNLRVRLDFRCHSGGGDIDSNLDNFLINSGTVIAL